MLKSGKYRIFYLTYCCIFKNYTYLCGVKLSILTLKRYEIRQKTNILKQRIIGFIKY
jgi:hypothetical protein